MTIQDRTTEAHGGFRLRGGGASGELFRSIDWSQHPLGPCDTWPEALKTALLILFHSQHPMFIWWGPDLYQFYNDAYLPSFGVGKHPSAMGQRAAECWPEIWTVIKPQIDQVMNEASSTWNVDQLVPIFRNGAIEEVYWTYGYSPIFTDSDTVGGTLVVCTETTQRVLAEKASKAAAEDAKQSAQSLHDFFMQVPLPIVIMEGPEHRFILANSHYEKFVGRHVMGKTLREAFSLEEISYFQPLIQNVYKTGIPYEAREVSLKVANAQGTIDDRWIDVDYYPFRWGDGSIRGVLAMVQDMTDRVLSRKALEVAKAEADTAKDDAERASQTKSAFLANMSHEIRTPLAAILGFADLLKDPGLELTERAGFVETISRNGKALTRIIDDILDLAKVESGRLEVEHIEFSLLDLLKEVMDLFRERTRAKGIYLKLNIAPSIPTRVYSDPTRVRQILINIVGNAVKFTREGGVTVDADASLHEAFRYRFMITVKDSGIGIPMDQRARLFQPFSQADDTTTRKYGGTGLGLVLSDRLARALDGGINVKEYDGSEGSTFVFDFFANVPQSFKDSTSVRLLTSAGPQKVLDQVRILVADDSLDSQFLARRILTRNGAIVESANNGLEAFRMAMKGSFDLVLMDIQMPSMDGYAATRALREAGFTKPIIALTAHAMAEERARSFASGCDGHLTKPLDQSELLTTIQTQMRMHRESQSPAQSMFDA